MYCRLLGTIGLEPVVCLQVVMEAGGSVKAEACDPRPVQKPCKGGVSTEGIIPRLFIFACKGIGIVLRIHASEIS